MKRWILITVSLVIVLTLLVAALFRLFRPSDEVAGIVENILDLTIAASWNDFEGPAAVRLDKKLDDLAKDKGIATAEAFVILLDYYLGEHNAEIQQCAVTSRGQEILPLLRKYHEKPARPWKVRYLLLRLPAKSRESMYNMAFDEIQHGRSLCD